MKKSILLITLSACCFLATGQNKATFSQYTISPVLINPAAAGFFEQHQVQLHARVQWTGFPGAPKTFGAQYNGPIGKTFSLGAGVFTDRAADLTELRAVLNYAFRFFAGDDVKLAAGFSTEYFQQTLDAGILNNSFNSANPDDEIINKAIDGRRTIDASIGIFGTFFENTYSGLAFTNLVGGRLDDISNSTSSNDSFFGRYTFLVGHRFDISDLGFSLEPSLMMRQVQNAPFMIDFNIKGGFLEDQLIAGLSYRTLGSLGVMLGTQLSNFHLYYTYDTSFQQIQKYNSGTHELTIALHFDGSSQKQPWNNPYR